jgi:hypothetical protein
MNSQLKDNFDGLRKPLKENQVIVKPVHNQTLIQYGLMSNYEVNKVYIEGANPSFIRSLRLQIGEDTDYDNVIIRGKSKGLGDATKIWQLF